MKKIVVILTAVAFACALLWLAFRTTIHSSGTEVGDRISLHRHFGKITSATLDLENDGVADYMLQWKWTRAYWSSRNLLMDVKGSEGAPDLQWKKWSREIKD